MWVGSQIGYETHLTPGRFGGMFRRALLVGEAVVTDPHFETIALWIVAVLVLVAPWALL